MTKPKKQILERTLEGELADVWELWTTKAGIESWWGPVGFTTEVQVLDLRAGGSLRYAMTATAREQVAFMKQAGMPLTTVTQVAFTAVEPMKRLAFENRVDFVAGTAPYDVGTEVTFRAAKGRVHLKIALDAMHDATWTQRMAMGWEQQLGKLEAVVKARPAKASGPARKRITPFLWFDDQAEQAAKFYVSVFKDGSKVTGLQRVGKKGPVLGVTFTLAGQDFMALNGGPHYELTPAFSMYVECANQKEVDHFWSKLLSGGGKPSRCGWLTDRFGLSWQVIPKQLPELMHAGGEAGGRVMEAMMKMAKIDVAALEAAARGEPAPKRKR